MSGAADFTLARYAELLRAAQEAGYAFVRFGALDEDDAPQRAIVLRHDIDYDPAFVAPVSAIEREAGVVATYCLQPDSLTYDIDGDAAHAAVDALLADGHDLGLHVDVTRVEDAALPSLVEHEAEAMAQRFGVRPVVVSWHMAGRRHAGHLEFDGLVNTYAPRFFGAIGYASDSNMSWRGTDLEALLRSGEHERLQVLTHPIWWREQPITLLAAMTELAERTGVALDDLLTPEQRALL